MSKAVGRILGGLLALALSGPVIADLNEVARLIDAGSHQQALAKLASEPESRRSRLLRANALAGLKRSDEAEAIYRGLIKEAPQDPAPYNNLATLYASSGRLQEASEWLTLGMKSDPRYAAIHENLSRIYVEMSRNSYAKALRLGEPQKELKLAMLDEGEGPKRPLQVAVVATPTLSPQPKPAPANLKAEEPAPKPVQTVQPPTTPIKPAPQPAQPAVEEKTPIEAQSPAVSSSGDAGFDAGGAIAALKRWAVAWSTKDVATYLDTYDVDFLPPRDLSRSQWQAERRIRLTKPKVIEVALSDFEVSSTGNGSLTVKLVQRYRSDSYHDTTRKGFILVNRQGQWKIGDEYTIEVIN